MNAKTPGQEAAEEARQACNNLSAEEKARLTEVAMPIIRANHPLDAFDESQHQAVLKAIMPKVSRSRKKN